MWELLNPKGDEFPPLESFGCVLVEDKIIVFCGYEGKKCEPVNDVYEYDIKQNSWKRLF
jgi:N-acetylneuraminic acid mutarotase